MEIKQYNGWKFREDEITMKQFYNLPQQEKDEYILLILGLKDEERSSMDILLLNRFGKNKLKPIKFLEL
jgi:hypothetical protein